MEPTNLATLQAVMLPAPCEKTSERLFDLWAFLSGSR